MDETRQTWDALLYDHKHQFVWRHGAALVDLLAPQPGERILDLGCGTGHLTAAIAAAGARVVGLDHAAEMLEQARRSFPHLEFLQADARAFAFPEPCDAVFSNAALHWIRPPEAVLRRVRHALKPGGRFVAELGGRGNVRAVIAAVQSALRQLSLLAPLPPWYFPGVAEYASLLEDAGLEVRFALLFDRPTPLEGAHGLRDWVAQFSGSVLQGIAVERREEFLHAVEEAAKPTLFQNGNWVADYRRLRVVAVRLT